jgi:transposase InsO family protein
MGLPEITAATIANQLMVYFCLFGIPQQLLSDQGTNYQSDLLKEVQVLLDIKQLKTTAYHPQTNGETERFN